MGRLSSPQTHLPEPFPVFEKNYNGTFLHWLQIANICYNYVQYLSNFVMLIRSQLILQNHRQKKTRHFMFGKFNT